MAKKRSPPFPPHPEWTSSKFFSFLRSRLRSGFTRWPPKYSVLTKARRKYTGRSAAQKWEFQCAVCSEWFKQTQVEVDHIVPCGSLMKFEDLPGFVERLFCGEAGLRVVCKPCHKSITKASREAKLEATTLHNS